MQTYLSMMSVRCSKTVSATDARPSRRRELLRLADGARTTSSANAGRLLESEFHCSLPNRRSMVTSLVAGCAMALSLPERPAWAVWEGAPEAPQVRALPDDALCSSDNEKIMLVGSCIDCVGEVGGTLNVCPLDTLSCSSTQNDDEQHFVAPWMYDCSREEAIEQLVSVATGGPYDPMLIGTPYGRSRKDVAGYILQGTVNVLLGQPPPTSKPQAVRQDVFDPFDGELVDQQTTEDGIEYLRFVFGGAQSNGEPSRVIDAEFAFIPNDNIITLRAASRVQPSGFEGKLKLSFTDSPLVLDANYSKQLLERLRKALRFEVVPVITNFDPRFNNDKQLWFEKLFDPKNERYQPNKDQQ